MPLQVHICGEYLHLVWGFKAVNQTEFDVWCNGNMEVKITNNMIEEKYFFFEVEPIL
jgi:hypothetical protein